MYKTILSFSMSFSALYSDNNIIPMLLYHLSYTYNCTYDSMFYNNIIYIIIWKGTRSGRL